MLDALDGRRPADLKDWLANGGDATLASYGAAGSLAGSLARVPRRHRDFLASLPYLHLDDHRVFVHAGVLPGAPLPDQHPDTFLWIRERFLRAAQTAFARHVVHGHTPSWANKPEPAVPERLPQRTNLDTGAYFTGVLTVGVFDEDLPGGACEVLRVTL
jgi:serine/threonine protein phosphatase 1